MQFTLETARAKGILFPTFLRRLINRPFIRHNVLLLVASILTGASNFLFHPIVEHLLGVNSYGTVASLLALLTILLIPTPIIIAIVARYASTFYADNRLDRLHDLVRRLTVLLLPLGSCIAIVIAVSGDAIASFFHLGSSQALHILALAFIASFASPINVGALQGLRHFGWYAGLTVMPAILRLLLAAIFVIAGFGVNGAVLGIALSLILPYVASFQPLRSLLAGPRSSSGTLKSVLSYSLSTAVALACMTLLFNLDTVLAKHYLTGHQAGLYAALATVGKTSLFVTSSIVAVMYPYVASNHAQGKPTTRIAIKSLLSVLALSAVSEAVFLICPSLILRALFGQDFVVIADQLAWYGLAMMLLALAQGLIYYFLSTGGRRFAMALPVSCVFMLLFVITNHQSPAAIVRAVVAANAILAIMLGMMFMWHARYEGRRFADSAGGQ